MFNGPVFRFELITTARRPRYFIARTLYGLFLLFTLWQEYRSWGVEVLQVTFETMSHFAQRTFMAFTWAQGLALIALVPSLFAGVIADEHQRKTLHYLLASRLFSAEIVLGKLGARLIHVVVIVLMGVPVVSLVGLFGGLDPWEVGAVYVGTCSLTLFLAGFSLLISVLTTRPRVAVVITYLLVFLWMFVPLMIRDQAHFLGPPLEWVAPVNDAVLTTNPYLAWQELTNIYRMTYLYLARGVGGGGTGGWISTIGNQAADRLYWMAGLQTGLGLLFLLAAVMVLRPIRGSSWPGSRAREKPRRAGAKSGTLRPTSPSGTQNPSPALAVSDGLEPASARRARPSLFRTVPSRPPCGDDENPVLWKEKFAAGGGLTWLRSLPVVLFFSVLLGCYLFDAGWPVVTGWFGQPLGMSPVQTLNGALRESSTFLYVVVILSVASAAAVSLSGEREQDSWTSLTATLLTGGEIVRGKILGALWCTKRLFVALFVILGYGVLLGAIHPLGAVVALLGLGVFSWFAAALGVYVSLRARTSARALAVTILWLFLLNGGYLVLLLPILGDRSEVLLAGMTPYVQWLALVSYADVRSLWSTGAFQVATFHSQHGGDALAMIALALGFYGLGALLLTGAAVDAFDKVVDRPRRGDDPPSPKLRPLRVGEALEASG